MTVIEIPDQQAERLRACAEREGLTLLDWLSKIASSSPEVEAPRSLKTGRGMFAKYGTAPSKEEIDQNRGEMFRGFGREF